MSCSLYFHIPFCTKKCPYCHFYVIPNQRRYHTLLMEGLRLEWDKRRPQLVEKTVASIYFGGGTPALLDPEELSEILSWCRSLPWDEKIEITLEANPEEITFDLLSSFQKAGVNRISLGVQSLEDESLCTLERAHTSAKAKEAIFLVKRAGIENLSIDLMYDLPSQTPSSWERTLNQLSSLPIDHLSLYNLTIEPHTSFYKNREKLSLPKPEQSLRMLHLATSTLPKLGLERYEISAFARPGFASRHNLGYWTYRPFLGFGPSAFSYWEQERFQNIPHLHRYVRELKEGRLPTSYREKLPFPQSLKEELAIRLRMIEGFQLPSELPQEIENALARLEAQNLLKKNGDRIRLSEKGLLFYDTVAGELI